VVRLPKLLASVDVVPRKTAICIDLPKGIPGNELQWDISYQSSAMTPRDLQYSGGVAKNHCLRGRFVADLPSRDVCRSATERLLTLTDHTTENPISTDATVRRLDGLEAQRCYYEYTRSS
jgi:hypothetical protein